LEAFSDPTPVSSKSAQSLAATLVFGALAFCALACGNATRAAGLTLEESQLLEQAARLGPRGEQLAFQQGQLQDVAASTLDPDGEVVAVVGP